jgi:hypothetical protein
MPEEVLTVVCAWCQRVVRAAPKATGVTHTICPPCLDRTIGVSADGGIDPAALHRAAGYFGDTSKD